MFVLFSRKVHKWTGLYELSSDAHSLCHVSSFFPALVFVTVFSFVEIRELLLRRKLLELNFKTWSALTSLVWCQAVAAPLDIVSTNCCLRNFRLQNWDTSGQIRSVVWPDRVGPRLYFPFSIHFLAAFYSLLRQCLEEKFKLLLVYFRTWTVANIKPHLDENHMFSCH